MRNRSWCWTLNNPVEEPEEICYAYHQGDLGIKYLIFQREQGDQHTEHFQGYVEFITLKSLAQVRGWLPLAHWEIRRGSRLQARDYCRKEESRIEGPWEVGTFMQQGERTDLVQFIADVREGLQTSELIDRHPGVMCRYPRFVGTIRTAQVRQRRLDLRVELHYGDTGLGKTRSAYDRYPELYAIPITNGQMWFDGYDGQEVVLMDDFAGAASKMELVKFLRLIDIYPVLVPVKGSHVYFEPMTIIVTTNLHPRNWWNWENRETQYRALARRIHQIFYYVADGIHITESDEDKQAFFDGHANYTNTTDEVIVYGNEEHYE